MILRKWQRGGGFVELLIVLGTLAILAALLFPVFARERHKAQQTTCVANLQQISHALSLYVSDYDGTYPPMMSKVVTRGIIDNRALVWSDLLQSYLHSNVFPTCPAREWPANVSRNVENTGAFSGYAINLFLNSSLGNLQRYSLEGRKDNSVTYPACTLTLLDVRTGVEFAARPDTIGSWEQFRQSYGGRMDETYFNLFLQQSPGAIRHNGGANYAFADGHVKWLKPEQLHTTEKSDGVNPGFGL